jgi:hypothetical protein
VEPARRSGLLSSAQAGPKVLPVDQFLYRIDSRNACPPTDVGSSFGIQHSHFAAVGLHSNPGISDFDLIFCTQIPEFKTLYVL